MRMKLISVIAAAGILFAGCSQGINKENAGAVLGGIAGGAAGAQVGKGRGRTAAIVAGTLLGAIVGGAVGKSMDETDQLKSRQAIMTSPTNQPVSWYNPKSGNQYQVTPVSHPQHQTNGATCRKYTTTATIDGKAETIYGTACRQADGTWEVR
ncbi:MAG: hypothetical protein GY862_30815 [Gammaproteobacteria bacterium]|nr:hypothetical protein [Gammaproteobacteria bacterium]